MTKDDLSAITTVTSDVILSQKYLEGCAYVNIGQSLSEALKDEDLASRFISMKSWDYLKRILHEGTKDDILAIENFDILFEPALKINPGAFLREAMAGRRLIIKLEYPVARDYHYYPFPADHTYYLDLTGISYTTC